MLFTVNLFTGIIKSREAIGILFSVSLSVSVFHAVKGVWLEPTQNYLNDLHKLKETVQMKLKIKTMLHKCLWLTKAMFGSSVCYDMT